jgi:hypothetical protein
LFAFAMVTACSSTDARPECHAALTHYFAAGCTVGGSETSAEDSCTSVGNTLPAECQSPFDALMTCLDAVPDPVSSSDQCNCDDDWESAIELCD